MRCSGAFMFAIAAMFVHRVAVLRACLFAVFNLYTCIVCVCVSVCLAGMFGNMVLIVGYRILASLWTVLFGCLCNAQG